MANSEELQAHMSGASGSEHELSRLDRPLDGWEERQTPAPSAANRPHHPGKCVVARVDLKGNKEETQEPARLCRWNQDLGQLGTNTGTNILSLGIIPPSFRKQNTIMDPLWYMMHGKALPLCRSIFRYCGTRSAKHIKH